MENYSAIFLEIDGVLNSIGDKELINGIAEENKLERLIDLSNEFEANIVIISNNNYYEKNKNLIDDLFKKYDKKVDYITYDNINTYKLSEIYNYLIAKKPFIYVILDSNIYDYETDEIIYENDYILYLRLVDTSENGFTEEKYDEAFERLNQPRYELKINGDPYFEDLLTCKGIALEKIEEFMSNKDIFGDIYPLYMDSFVSNKLSNGEIDNSLILLSKRLKRLLTLLKKDIVEAINPLDIIEKSYSYHESDYANHDYKIIKRQNEIIIDLREDNNYLITNMFGIDKNKIDNYYFKAYLSDFNNTKQYKIDIFMKRYDKNSEEIEEK